MHKQPTTRPAELDDADRVSQWIAPETLAEFRNSIIVALHELGVLKPGEVTRRQHKYGCPTIEPPHDASACTCPDGPELVWCDWNKFTAEYVIPERFYVRH